MTPLTLKARLISAAIGHLDKLVNGFKEDAKYHVRGEGSTDEGGFTGTFGDYSAQSTANQLREQAMRDRADAEKHEQTIAALERLDTNIETSAVQLMSLVDTNHGTFLVSLAARPVELDGKKYMFLATDAPIYSEMMGKTKGDTFSFRGIAYEILNVS